VPDRVNERPLHHFLPYNKICFDGKSSYFDHHIARQKSLVR